MVWLWTELLPQRSVAVQVRVRVKLPAQLPGVVTALNVIVGAGSQSSIAVGLAGGDIASHSALVSAGTPLSTGGVVSLTVIVCSQLELLPHPSVATQWRLIVKLSAQFPGVTVSLCVTVTPLHASVAVAVPVADGSVDWLHDTVASIGHVIAGGVVSLKLMRWLAAAPRPQLSVAVQVRVITSLQLEPGLLSVCCKTTVT